MTFAIGDFVKLLNATAAEGKVQGYKLHQEEVNGVMTKSIQQYLVKFMGDAIWVDEDRLVRSAHPRARG